MPFMGTVTTIEELEELYGEVKRPSVIKETTYLTPEYRSIVAASPFFVLASSGQTGLDCSPRGDQPGFVRVVDQTTLLVPDRRGNNRIDTLRNIIHDPRVALLFFVPGVGETLRVNGSAAISSDPQLLESFTFKGKTPRTVLSVSIEAVYFQCSRAILRSGLWSSNSHVDRASLPSCGAILSAIAEDLDGDDYDRKLPDRLHETLY